MMNDKMHTVKNVAVVAQDKRKNELIEWSFHNRHLLGRHQLIAFGEAADVLEGTVNAPVRKLMPGNLGGYEQLEKMIGDGAVDMIIFLWDAKKTEPYESDIKTLQQMAEENNLVVATNGKTAEAVLSSTYFNNDELSEETLRNMFHARAI